MHLSATILDNGLLKVDLGGRLDLPNTLAIEDRFTFQAATRAINVVVDLSGVDFIATIGIRMLVKNAKAISHRGYRMVLLNPQPLVREALETAAIDTLIPIYDDIESAGTALLD